MKKDIARFFKTQSSLFLVLKQIELIYDVMRVNNRIDFSYNLNFYNDLIFVGVRISQINFFL